MVLLLIKFDTRNILWMIQIKVWTGMVIERCVRENVIMVIVRTIHKYSHSPLTHRKVLNYPPLSKIDVAMWLSLANKM